jgi:hypothetical protein
MDIYIVTSICPLLGNGSVNVFAQHKRSIIEGHILLGNEQVDARSGHEKTVFSVGSMQSGYT